MWRCSRQGRVFGSSRRRRCSGGCVVALGFAESVFEQPLPMLMVSAPAVSFVSAERAAIWPGSFGWPTERHCWQWPKCPWVRWLMFWFRAWTLPGCRSRWSVPRVRFFSTMPRQEGALARVLTPPLAELDVTGPQWNARARLGGRAGPGGVPPVDVPGLAHCRQRAAARRAGAIGARRAMASCSRRWASW